MGRLAEGGADLHPRTWLATAGGVDGAWEDLGSGRASAASAICNRASATARCTTPRARSATTAKFIMGRRALMCQC